MSGFLQERQDRAWYYASQAQTVIKNLDKRNMVGHYAEDRQEALAEVLELIPEGATVTRAGSLTLEQVGIFPELEKRGVTRVNNVSKRNEDGSFFYPPETRQRMLREVFSSDVFLTGCNAITLDGCLVNIDGTGNRVAAMIFGPQKVIVVAGVNKIVKDTEAGIMRIRQVAGPLTAMKRNLDEEPDSLPCLSTGYCVDCNHVGRICRNTTIIEGCMTYLKGRITVVIVGEDLGY